VFWWCSSRGKVASGEVGQQRRSQGHRLQRADVVPEMVARMLGPRWCSTERSLLRPPGCGAASGCRRSAAARRLQAVGKAARGVRARAI